MCRRVVGGAIGGGGLTLRKLPELAGGRLCAKLRRLGVGSIEHDVIGCTTQLREATQVHAHDAVDEQDRV